MKFIEKVRLNSLKGIDKNKKEEYKKTLDAINIESKRGRFTCKYEILSYYENKDDIYCYIIEKLRQQGFEVDLEEFGVKSLCTRTRLCISWKKQSK